MGDVESRKEKGVFDTRTRFMVYAEMRGRRGQNRSACPVQSQLSAARLQGRVRAPLTSECIRRLWTDIQVLFMPCVFVSVHFFIFLFFLCRLRMRFLAHLSLIFS